MKNCIFLKPKWLSKSLFVFMVLTISIFSCKKDLVDIKDTSTEISDVNNDIYTVAEVRTLFDQKKPLDWKTEKDAKFIYSVGVHTDPIYSVGYKPKNITNLMEIIHLIDIHSDEWKNVEDKVMDELLKNEGKKKNEVLIHHFDPLPSFVVQGLSLSTIEKLIAMDEVMYVEPKTTTIFAPNYSKVNLREDDENGGLPYEYDAEAQVGCNCGEGTTVNTMDFATLPVDTKQSWHFIEHKINQNSWGISTGTGIGIAILDTGVSDEQDNLYAYKFGYTWPYQRNHYRSNFLLTHAQVIGKTQSAEPLPWIIPNVNDTHDRCGHGTRMAGIATAPRGSNGSAVGVAYGADLHSMRVAHNTILDYYSEKLALVNALNSAKENIGIQIISISLGMTPGASDTDIAMAIQAAYLTNEKLIFCAAGSSTPATNGLGVVFPANLTSTYAVTGIRDYLISGGPVSNTTVACDICHSGPEVDFSVIMQRTLTSTSTAVGLNCTNNVPVYTSGTSAATATMAGIAALIWANKGVDTPAGEIEGILLNSASNVDNPHDDFGFGWIDVELALSL